MVKSNKWRDGYATPRHKVQVVHDEALILTPSRAGAVSSLVAAKLFNGMSRFPMELINIHIPMFDKCRELE